MFVTITGTITDFKVDVTRDSVTDVTAPAVRSYAAVVASSAAQVINGVHSEALFCCRVLAAFWRASLWLPAIGSPEGTAGAKDF